MASFLGSTCQCGPTCFSCKLLKIAGLLIVCEQIHDKISRTCFVGILMTMSPKIQASFPQDHDSVCIGGRWKQRAEALGSHSSGP